MNVAIGICEDDAQHAEFIQRVFPLAAWNTYKFLMSINILQLK